MFDRFKSTGNQSRYNRRKPRNWFGRLTWARDRSSISDRSIPMRSGFADRVNWTSSISICYAFLCVLHIDQDRLVRIDWVLIDRSHWIEYLWCLVILFYFIWGFLMFSFVLITLIIYYILIFNNCFVNCNFEFINEIQVTIIILKIISLMRYIVYEISLMKHYYHFLV